VLRSTEMVEPNDVHEQLKPHIPEGVTATMGLLIVDDVSILVVGGWFVGTHGCTNLVRRVCYRSNGNVCALFVVMMVG
jgi:hypothetical protein